MGEVLRFIGLEWCEEMNHYRDVAKTETIKTPSYRDVTSEVYDRAAYGKFCPIFNSLPIRLRTREHRSLLRVRDGHQVDPSEESGGVLR
jgi:hypothetical protein